MLTNVGELNKLTDLEVLNEYKLINKRQSNASSKMRSLIISRAEAIIRRHAPQIKALRDKGLSDEEVKEQFKV